MAHHKSNWGPLYNLWHIKNCVCYQKGTECFAPHHFAKATAYVLVIVDVVVVVSFHPFLFPTLLVGVVRVPLGVLFFLSPLLLPLLATAEPPVCLRNKLQSKLQSKLSICAPLSLCRRPLCLYICGPTRVGI